MKLRIQPGNTVEDTDAVGKRVRARAEFNTPLQNGEVAEGFRVRAALTTIRYLVESRGNSLFASPA